MEEYDSTVERQIITGMICSTEFLSQITPHLNIDLFESPHIKQVSKWVLKYYDKYKRAPGRDIEKWFHNWERGTKPSPEKSEPIAALLAHLSDEYVENQDDYVCNVPYLIDNSAHHFDRRKLEIIKDNLEYHLEKDDLEKARDCLCFEPTEINESYGIDPLTEDDVWDRAFSESQKPLITFPGKDARRFFGEELGRDCFIGIFAPEKRGKTFWCIEFMHQALKSGYRVAMFQAGDLSENQFLRRYGSKLARLPQKRHQVGKHKIITELDLTDKQHKSKFITSERTVSKKSALLAAERIRKRLGISKNSKRLKVSTHPNKTLTVAKINDILNSWEKEGFIADVVIIDYADILADEPNTANMTSRDKINYQWAMMRRLNLEKHNLLIVPTQADIEAQNVSSLTLKNFTEDKRKIGHVTALLALNQTKDEREQKILRVAWLVRREDELNVNIQLVCGLCLELGIVCSTSKLGYFNV